MSRRRKAEGGPLSLFSFQDVITSISGIMILVVLMLMLSILNRKAQTAPPPPVEDPIELERALATLRTEVREVGDQVARAQTRVDRLSKTDYDQLSSTLATEEARREQMEAEIAKLEADLKSLGQNSDKLSGENKSLEKTVREKAEELAKLQAVLAKGQADQVRFVTREKTTKMPILVECSAKGIWAKILDEDKKVVSFADPKSVHVRSAMEAFQAWAKSRRPGAVTFVVLIKPSASAYGRKVARDLRKAGFDVGHEPLEEDKTAVFKE